MEFIFQGFQSSLPIWFYILLFAGTTWLAWWSYSNISGIRKSQFYILFLLRSGAFFILLLLLLNPLFKSESSRLEPPNILIMLDNSASTAMEKQVYRGTESYSDLLEELNFQNQNSIAFNFYSIGNRTHSISPGELTFNDDQTDLSQTVQEIKRQKDKANAAIIVSDGIYTKGQNPIYETQDLPIPIFTIGLGDTTAYKDLSVSSVATNETGYLNSIQTVIATIHSNGFKDESFPVRLQKGDQILSAKTVTPDISSSTTEVSFDLSLNEEGLQQYDITIPELEEERTSANNSQLFSVDVRNDKQRILSLAFDMHPDLKFMRSLLLQDQNIQLTNYTWLGSNTFIEGPFSSNPDTVDLAIIHGYPSSGLPAEIKSSVKQLAEQVPVVIAATPLFDAERFEQEITSLPVTGPSQQDYASISIIPEQKSVGHPIMELPVFNHEQSSSISAPIQNLELSPGATILFESSFEGNDTKMPVVAVEELGNKRMTIFTGFGWYRLNQSPISGEREFVRQLWLNSVSWTATDPDNQKLNVKPTKTSFSESEAVIINAYLKNERGETESQATIDLSISSDSMDQRMYPMENIGPGEYQVDLNNMREGVYAFEATAQKQGRTIDSYSGEFAVARSNAEYMHVKRDEQLLRQLSNRTGGTYISFDSISGFWNTLRQAKVLEPRSKVDSTILYPYRQITWFIMILLLLSAEWGFRKYLSLP